jgi:hypothetical protein
MKISRTGTSPARRLLCLPILAGAMLAMVGAQPALAQRGETRFQEEQRIQEEHRVEQQRFQTAQRAAERRDEHRIPPGHEKQRYRPPAHYGYYEAPRYVYAPPPVVYAPPSGLEFVFPLTFR